MNHEHPIKSNAIIDGPVACQWLLTKKRYRPQGDIRCR